MKKVVVNLSDWLRIVDSFDQGFIGVAAKWMKGFFEHCSHDGMGISQTKGYYQV